MLVGSLMFSFYFFLPGFFLLSAFCKFSATLNFTMSVINRLGSG